MKPLQPGTQTERTYILPTLNGIAFVLGAMGVIGLGIASNQSILIFLGICLLVFFIVGMFQTNQNMKHLSIGPIRIPPAPLGTEALITISAENVGKQAIFALGAEVKILSAPIRAYIAALPQRTPGAFRFVFPTRQRGKFPLNSVRLYTVFPVGLFYAWKFVPVQQDCIIYPQPLGGIPLPPLTVFQEGDERSGGFYGEDFSGHRPYQPGDSQKRVDWKARARGLPLLLKQFEHASEAVHVLNWDALHPLLPEARLSQLTAWVLACHAAQTPYILLLPGVSPSHSNHSNAYYTSLSLLATYPGHAE